MSEATAQPETRRTQATVRTTRGPGWIWAVPLAAAGIVAWLAIRAVSNHGIDVTVIFDDAAGLNANGGSVTYRGVEIGQVTDVAITGDGEHVRAGLRIDRSMKGRVTSGTRFYLVGAHPSLSDPASLKAVLAGPTIVMIPGPGAPTRHFVGASGAPAEPIAGAVSFTAQFDGPVGELAPGAPVTLRGFTVGQVEQVRLVYDVDSGRLRAPVVMALDPARIRVADDSAPAGAGRAPVVETMMRELVRDGLRARLTKAPPLIGGMGVELAFVPRPAPETLATVGGMPEIPTAPGGGVGNLLTELGSVPVADIARNVRAITGRVRRLVSSPELTASLDHLDRALAGLDTTIRVAGPEIGPTIAQLRRTADGLDATATSAERLVGDTPRSPSGNLQQTLRELGEAARAIRTLADYLDQHPEALLRGRSP